MIKELGSSLLDNNTKGYLRDNAIYDAIQTWKALDTLQLHKIFFPSVSVRATQMRLKTLAGRYNELKSSRDSIYHNNFFYIGKRPVYPEHWLGTNWIRLWMTDFQRGEGWETYHFEYTPNYGYLVPDALIGFQSTKSDIRRCRYIELDLSDNDFDKMDKYYQWFNSHDWQYLNWAKGIERFPRICVFTYRVKYIERKVAKNNEDSSRPFFQVFDFNKIKKECVNNDLGRYSSPLGWLRYTRICSVGDTNIRTIR